MDRRNFLKSTAMAGAGAALYSAFGADKAFPFSQSDNLRKFVQNLRGVGTIPVATPDAINPGWWQPGVTHYTISIGQFEDQLHPDLPNATRLWGFGQNNYFKHLGGIIAAKRGQPVQITFQNNLPVPHILPVDTTIMGADGPVNRCDIHLHGGFVPWSSDGGPFAYWDPNGNRGPSFVNALGAPIANNEAEYFYPNQQSARLMWYHDHTFGNTRLNAYAGIATGYVVYDDYELSLVTSNALPGPLDPRTQYLVFQDKTFVGNNTPIMDPSWYMVMPNSRPGDLWYAHVYETARWALGPTPDGLPPDPSVIPEFFGDTMLVNGTVYPTLHVQPRQYRFRMLNACQARFLNPRLVYAQGTGFPSSTEPKPTALGPAFVQIGTEGGFLPAPVMLNGPNQPLLLLAPAERADLIVDFRNVAPASILLLYNDAPAPFPMGDARNDYSPDNSKTPNAKRGYGPNTRTLLQIIVDPLTGPVDAPIALPAQMTPTDPFLISQTPGVPTTYTINSSGVASVTLANGANVDAPVRYLTLNETFDTRGRLIQFLGTNQAPLTAKKPTFGRGYMDNPTEVVSAGSYEIWEVINLTGDTHPIHFHLVNVEVLSRQAFATSSYTGGIPNYQGAPIAPDANELGWKETVRMNPGQVTRVLMKFDLPNVPFTVPESPRLKNDYSISGGNEYVWHCHILEHEEHDMMRPLVVV